MRTLSTESVRVPARQFDRPQPARVLRVAGSRLFVELDGVRGLEVEARWSRPLAPHSHTVTTSTSSTYTPPDPPAGTRCLLLFAGQGVADAWVVAWSGWPA